ncbi:MAG: energy transducer TonB [Bacteroidales bacterium]|nr:energy transducer TonB [Bacteroidales bacterium]
MKTILIITILTLFPLIIFSQIQTDTVCYDVFHNKCICSENYLWKKIYKYSDLDKNSGSIITMFKGIIKSEISYSDINNEVKDGVSIFYFNNGNIERKLFYIENQLNDTLFTYHKNGNIKRKDVYENNKVVSGSCYDINGFDTTYFPYIVQPKYPGGEEKLRKDIANNLVYPKKALRKGIQDTVIVSVYLLKDGNFRVAPAPPSRVKNKELIEEGIRVVRLLDKWTPGFIDGEPSSFSIEIPIVFRIE